jgi:hypothetical protein
MKYPTMGEYHAALVHADNEYDGGRSVSKLMKYLVYFANNNPRLRGHINTRQTAISSWAWEISAPDGTKNADTIDATHRQSDAIALLRRTAETAALYEIFFIDLR